MKNELQREMKQKIAEKWLQMGHSLMVFLDGDTYLNGVLVATEEGIIQ